jgi:hypothetical protein
VVEMLYAVIIGQTAYWKINLFSIDLKFIDSFIG